MATPLDLYVLRRVAELAENDGPVPMPAIVSACAGVIYPERYVHRLCEYGLLQSDVNRRRDCPETTYDPSPGGLAALEAEPKVMRDRPGLTNR
jgi:hypothetical protein